ncbi:uncharacterized protein METZ01_LOCUS198089, partial [marine metagenome]
MEIGLYDSYPISLFPFNRTVVNVIEFSIKSIVMCWRSALYRTSAPDLRA